MVEKARKKNPPKWEHSTRLSELDVAFKWGLRPSRLGLCRVDEDLPYMAAYLETKALMEFVDGYVAEEDAKRKEKQGKKK